MTFEQFIATRQYAPDLAALIPDAHWDNGPTPSGYVYMGALFIEDVTEAWPEASRKLGKHHLMLGRSEWISDDREALERRLYAWALREGYTL